MNIKVVKFHQGVRMGANLLTSINMNQKADRDQFDVKFDKGLIHILDRKAKDKTQDTALIGLANVCYMITGSDSSKEESVKKPAKKVTKKAA